MMPTIPKASVISWINDQDVFSNQDLLDHFGLRGQDNKDVWRINNVKLSLVKGGYVQTVSIGKYITVKKAPLDTPLKCKWQ